MTILSLRVTISALAAISVAVIAIVTLTITLTSSLDALRNVGKLQAASLLSVANAQTTALFAQGSDSLIDSMHMGTSERWGYPSEDPISFAKLQAATHALFVRNPYKLSSFNLWFYDNTQFWYDSLNATYYAEYIVSASPFSTTFPNSNVTGVLNIRRWSDGTVLPQDVANTVLPPNFFPLFRVSDGVWQSQTLPATLNGASPLIAGVYPSITGGELTQSIAMVAPFYRKGDAHIGPNMFANPSATFDVTMLSQFLANLGGTANTVTIVADGHGFIMASSMVATLSFTTVTVPTDPTAAAPTGCSYTSSITTVGVPSLVCRTALTAYPYAPLQSIAQSRPDIVMPSTSTVSWLSIGSNNYFVASGPVPLAFPGMSLYIVLIIPEMDIIGNVVSGRNTAIGITCGLFVFVVLLNFGLVSLLLSPLVRIAERMMDAANLEDSGVRDEPSAMDEVRQLQDAYFEMNEELNRIRSFVPQAILAARRVEADAVDLDLQQSTNDETASRVTRHTGGGSSRHSRRTKHGAGDPSKRSSGARSGSIGAALTSTMELHGTNGTVLIGNLAGLHTAAAVANAVDLCHGLNAVVEVVDKAVSSRQGVFTFHGDRFMATFNAARPCAAHARRAAEAGIEMAAGVPEVGLRLRIHVGIATGAFMVGSVGSASVKAFSSISNAVTQATGLEKVGREFGCYVLATQRTVLDVNVHVDYRYVDLIPLQGRDGQLKPTLVAELRLAEKKRQSSSAGVVDAEWLYVVKDGAKECAPRNKVFEALAQEQFMEAQTLYAALPDDEKESMQHRDGLVRLLSSTH